MNSNMTTWIMLFYEKSLPLYLACITLFYLRGRNDRKCSVIYWKETEHAPAPTAHLRRVEHF